MSFHKRHLPEIEDLKRIHSECSDDKEFLQRVIGKADAIVGSSDSMSYVDEIHNRVYPKPKTWTDLAKINDSPEKWIEMYNHYQELLTIEDQFYSCDNERRNLKGGESAKDWLEVFVKWQKAQYSHTIDGLQDFLEKRCYPPAYRKNGEV